MTTISQIDAFQLKKLESQIGIITINGLVELQQATKMNRSIIYLNVVWSAAEKLSRYVLYQTLCRLDCGQVPIFKLVVSDSNYNKGYEEWIFSIKKKHPSLYYGGRGELLLMGNEQLLGFVGNPYLIQKDKLSDILTSWLAHDLGQDWETVFWEEKRP